MDGVANGIPGDVPGNGIPGGDVTAILLMSGKGGVGKSTVTALLGHGIHQALSEPTLIFDVDLTGPSAPTALCHHIDNKAAEIGQDEWGQWIPVKVTEDGKLTLISLGFMLDSDHDAVIWRGARKTGMIKQMVNNTINTSNAPRGSIVLVDTPPGSSDEHISIVDTLRQHERIGKIGVVLIISSQALSMDDVTRQRTFCQKLNLPVIGLVSNMAGSVKCDHCSVDIELSKIFGKSHVPFRLFADEISVPFIQSIPFNSSYQDFDYSKASEDVLEMVSAVKAFVRNQ